MACCGSRSWKAPIYFTASLLLAFIAISASLHAKLGERTSPTKVASLELSLNASKALRRSGFQAMATLLQVSPETFLAAPNATIFALQDPAIANSSLPPWLFKNLLRYHTAPLNLPMADLLKKPQGICIPTILDPRKSLAVTRVDPGERSVEINGVRVSHPDLFLSKTLSVHGVAGMFSPVDPDDLRQGWSSIRAPACNSSSLLVPEASRVEWALIVRLLSSNGFVPFAIGLNSVLDGILEDGNGLESVTLFAPPSLPSLASPSALLRRTVRFHVLPRKMSYEELASMQEGTSLVTLASDLRAVLTRMTGSARGLVINGAEIVAPNMFSSESFTVHGISKAFDVSDPFVKPMI